VKEYDGKVRVVFKNMVVHPQQVMTAHLAGCAAAKQQKFVPFYHAFWDKAFTPYAQSRDPSKLGEENIMAIAKDLGMDTAKFKADMDGAECKALVQADMAELQKFKVNGTPGFFINGKFVGGALDKAGFKQIIDERLKAAEASGVSGAEYYDKEVMAKGEKQFRSAVEANP
jgi:protein-disulfide isomerase